MQIPTLIKIHVHNGNTFIYFYHLTLQLVKSKLKGNFNPHNYLLFVWFLFLINLL